MLELYKKKKDIEAWLKEHSISDYTLIKNKEYGWVVDVSRGVLIRNTDLTQLRVKFNHINGFFSCHNNKLTTLYGAPEVVGGYFSCSVNNLTSLEFSPKRADSLDASHNKITSFTGLSSEIDVVHIGSNKIRDFKAFPKQRILHLDVSNNLITSLVGSPSEIDGVFRCFDNKITSLQGCPQVEDTFYYDARHIVDHSYIPQFVRRAVVAHFNRGLDLCEYTKDNFDSALMALKEEQELGLEIAIGNKNINTARQKI